MIACTFSVKYFYMPKRYQMYIFRQGFSPDLQSYVSNFLAYLLIWLAKIGNSALIYSTLSSWESLSKPAPSMVFSSVSGNFSLLIAQVPNLGVIWDFSFNFIPHFNPSNNPTGFHVKIFLEFNHFSPSPVLPHWSKPASSPYWIIIIISSLVFHLPHSLQSVLSEAISN